MKLSSSLVVSLTPAFIILVQGIFSYLQQKSNHVVISKNKVMEKMYDKKYTAYKNVTTAIFFFLKDSSVRWDCV